MGFGKARVKRNCGNCETAVKQPATCGTSAHRRRDPLGGRPGAGPPGGQGRACYHCSIFNPVLRCSSNEFRDPAAGPQQAQSPATLTIASRESRLAMWQAEHVRDALRKLYPACDVKILGMTTRGDQILDRTLSKVGGKGLFVKELEAALADGRADLAVHSLKDVPMALPTASRSPRSWNVRTRAMHSCRTTTRRSTRCRPAPWSVRRACAARRCCARATRLDVLRGTRHAPREIDRGDYAAIILAAAGLKRLGGSAHSHADRRRSQPARGRRRARHRDRIAPRRRRRMARTAARPADRARGRGRADGVARARRQL